MTFALPERTHLVMKAVDPEKLSKKAHAAWLERNHEDFSWEVKYDGCSLIIICDNDGNTYMFSRQGEPVRSMGRLAEDFAWNPMSRGRVFFAEAWHPDLPFEVISGKFRQHDPAPELLAVVFDSVLLEEFIAGKSDTPYHLRKQHGIWALPKGVYWAAGFQHRVECEHYVGSQRDAGRTFATDGLVVRARTLGWAAGTAKRGETVKQKNKLSLDLRVLELVEGVGEWAGEVGAFVCAYNGGTINAQRGRLTKEEAKAMWENRALIADGITALIIEVTALSGSSKGKLREPHYVRTRTDKLPHETD